MRSRFRDHKTELSELRRHIRRGDVVCDIGANKGSFLYWLARWSAPGRVVAFEPQPDLAERLARLCKRFSLDNVVVEPRAVYSCSSKKTLFVPEGHQPGASLLRPAETSKAIQVQTTSLDDYLPDTGNVSAIKIDVEGAELDVLRGAERTLRRCRPLIVVECDHRLATLDRVKETFLLLRGLGYRGQFLSRGRLLPLSGFDPEIHQRADGEWFWKRKDYCNNFIFRSLHAPTSGTADEPGWSMMTSQSLINRPSPAQDETFREPIETISPRLRSRRETDPRHVAEHQIDRRGYRCPRC